MSDDDAWVMTGPNRRSSSEVARDPADTAERHTIQLVDHTHAGGLEAEDERHPAPPSHFREVLSKLLALNRADGIAGSGVDDGASTGLGKAGSGTSRAPDMDGDLPATSAQGRLAGLAKALRDAGLVSVLPGAPSVPDRFKQYVVLGTLGRGGMGVVLEAFDKSLDRKVAIKLLHRDLGGAHSQRLLREAKALARLSHPNVVQVHEVDEVEGQAYVAMELVEGQTLQEWQAERRPWRECVQVYLQAGRGLAAAHAKRLVHRDFKPGNAILDEDGRARVLDFGLVRRSNEEAVDDDEDRGGVPSTIEPARTEAQQVVPLDLSLTDTGTVLGTPAYMPLEQTQGGEADAKSDQFSFCVSLWEAVYGERPFEGATLTELVAAMKDGVVRAVPKGSDVSVTLRKVLLRGLAADPMQRWPSMDALLEQLQRLVAPRARRWVALGLTAGLAALGGGLALGQYVEVMDRCTGAKTQLAGTLGRGPQAGGEGGHPRDGARLCPGDMGASGAAAG